MGWQAAVRSSPEQCRRDLLYSDERPGLQRPAPPDNRLRVALVAGTLVQDGAEKQLVYMVRALREAGADVQVCSLSRGEFYEGVLADLGVPPRWIGKRRSPWLRLASLIGVLWKFRPHIVQSAHFYTNPYATISARFLGAVPIACSRSDIVFD